MLGLEFSVAEVSGLRITKSSVFVVCCGGRRPPLRYSLLYYFLFLKLKPK